MWICILSQRLKLMSFRSIQCPNKGKHFWKMEGVEPHLDNKSQYQAFSKRKLNLHLEWHPAIACRTSQILEFLIKSPWVQGLNNEPNFQNTTILTHNWGVRPLVDQRSIYSLQGGNKDSMSNHVRYELTWWMSRQTWLHV